MAKLSEDVKEGLRKQRAQLERKRVRQAEALKETEESIASLDAIIETG